MAQKVQDAGNRKSDISCPMPSIDTATLIHTLHKSPRVLRMKQLVDRTGLSRATLYLLMSSDHTFPRKIKLTERSVGFLETEIDEWITNRPRVHETIQATNGNLKAAA